MTVTTRSLNGSAIYVIGIVVTAVFSLAAFIAIEVLRPGMDNALLYGQVFLFAGTIITGLFGSMKTKENKEAIGKTNEVVTKIDAQVAVVHEKVDGLNQAALFNQEKLSLREGFDKGVAATAQVAAAAMNPVPVPPLDTTHPRTAPPARPTDKTQIYRKGKKSP